MFCVLTCLCVYSLFASSWEQWNLNLRSLHTARRHSNHWQCVQTLPSHTSGSSQLHHASLDMGGAFSVPPARPGNGRRGAQLPTQSPPAKCAQRASRHWLLVPCRWRSAQVSAVSAIDHLPLLDTLHTHIYMLDTLHAHTHTHTHTHTHIYMYIYGVMYTCVIVM